jgi:excisionase family DNA binding protein
MSNEWSIPLPSDFLEALADQAAEKLAERMAPPVEPFWTVDQAADYLSVPKSRIYELKEKEAIASYPEGRSVRFRRADLDAYMGR